MKIKVEGMKRLTAALHAVMRETKKAEVDIVNKALKDVGFKSMQYTKFADPGLIQAQLYRDDILIKMAARRVAKRAGTVKLNRFGTSRLTKTGKESKFGRATRSAIKVEAGKMLRRAVKSSKALRAGWIRGLHRIGAQVRGAGKLNPSGSASRGTGEKATINRLVGFIENALVTRARATGRSTRVENIGEAVKALNRAIREVSSDREDYARKKMIDNVLKKHSDR
jgi:hypothetical protein